MNTRLILALSLGLVCALALHPAQAKKLERGELIPDQYIVVLSKDRGLFSNAPDRLPKLADELTRQYGGQILYTFGTALNGYLARLTPGQASALAKSPSVKYVEQDSVVSQFDDQKNATWGLDRVDQRKLPLDQRFRYPDRAGDDVNLYIIDTGVRGSHAEFKGRIGGGANFAAAGPGPGGGLLDGALDLLNPGKAEPNDWNDCNGHGTHVAGSAAGASYGIARKATIYAVRVLGCDGSGTNSGVIAGVDWVAKNAKKPAVANLSLGGGNSTALDDAIKKLISSGVTTVVAAGNDDKDACTGSPNRVPQAITVGATDKSDKRSSFSNWGKCVDLSAPGTDITSAWFQSDSQTKTISGTSMAAPHAAGAAAIYLAGNRQARPADVAKALLENSSREVLGNLRGSPNRLLYVTEGKPEKPAPAHEPPQQPRNTLPIPKLPIGG
jgi:subtilisin family serine protease